MTSETCRVFLGGLNGFLKKPQNPDVPILLRPKAPELEGQRRPTWLALIFHFFSPKFAEGFMISALWPISLWMPPTLLPITFFVFMLGPTVVVF